MSDPDAVKAHLRGLEQLLDDPPPLLSVVVLANGTGWMVAHPMLDEAPPELLEARLRVVREQLVYLATHFGRMVEERARGRRAAP